MGLRRAEGRAAAEVERRIVELAVADNILAAVEELRTVAADIRLAGGSHTEAVRSIHLGVAVERRVV